MTGFDHRSLHLVTNTGKRPEKPKFKVFEPKAAEKVKNLIHYNRNASMFHVH